MSDLSLIRHNLLTRPGYSPYCGNPMCKHGMPRTTFNGHQFECRCGWESRFDGEFIEQYKRERPTPSPTAGESR